MIIYLFIIRKIGTELNLFSPSIPFFLTSKRRTTSKQNPPFLKSRDDKLPHLSKIVVCLSEVLGFSIVALTLNNHTLIVSYQNGSNLFQFEAANVYFLMKRVSLKKFIIVQNMRGKDHQLLIFE